MIDLIAKIIGGGDLSIVLLIVVGYIFILWFLFSFWVFRDAKRRYKKTAIAILFFLVVFIFNFPAFVFYMITRPEDDEDYVLLPADNLSNRGVNVPIVNFVGKDGKINLSFELKINNEAMLGRVSDMSVDVNWNSKNENFKKEEIKVTEVKVENGKEVTVEQSKTVTTTNKAKLANSYKNAKNKFKNLKPHINLAKKSKAS